MATNQQLLDDAKAAYHSLMTGTMARVVVDIDGSRTEFTATNAARLYAYIQTLERTLPFFFNDTATTEIYTF